MSLRDVLDTFTKNEVYDIGRTLETTGKTSQSKAEVISAITRALGQRQRANGLSPWRQPADVLTTERLRKAIESGDWIGDRAIYLPKNIGTLRKEQQQELLVALGIASDKKDEGKAVREFCESSSYSRYFDAFDPLEEAEEEDDGAGWDDDLSTEFEHDDEDDAWTQDNEYEAGPGLTYAPERPLEAHQRRSVQSLREWWAGPNANSVLCLPTGAGKTRTAVSFVLHDVVAHGGKVLWLAHRSELVNQAIAALRENGHEAGKRFTIGRFEAGARKSEQTNDVVVASISTLAHGRLTNLKRLHRRNGRFQLVVVDEAHHAPASSWNRLLVALARETPAPRLLGLTATPTRSGAREKAALWRTFGQLIHEERILPLIREGVLARPILKHVSTGRRFELAADELALYEKFHDIPQHALRRIGEDGIRNRLIVDEFMKNPRQWGQTIVFCWPRSQANELGRELTARGATAVVVDGQMSREEREDRLKAFAERRAQVLLNVSLFTEGTDLPKVEPSSLRGPPTPPPCSDRWSVVAFAGHSLAGPTPARLSGFSTTW